MRLARITPLVWFFLCLWLGRAPPPPTLRIGDIDDDLTEFNVGEGNTDESDSLNIIYIANTSGTLDGISNNPGNTSGSKYYTFSILAPGCASPGTSEVRVDTTFDHDGHMTRTSSVELRLTVQAWQTTVYDLHQNRSQFAMCLQADIMTFNAQLSPVLLERKHFDFVVTILLPTFDFDDPSLDDNGQLVFLLPCRIRKKQTTKTIQSEFESYRGSLTRFFGDCVLYLF